MCKGYVMQLSIHKMAKLTQQSQLNNDIDLKLADKAVETKRPAEKSLQNCNGLALTQILGCLPTEECISEC